MDVIEDYPEDKKEYFKNIFQLLKAQSSDNFKYDFNTNVDLKIR